MEEQDRVRGMSFAALIIITVELVLIVGAIVMTINFFNRKDNAGVEQTYDVRIVNFRQEIPNIDKDGLDDIRFSLYDIVWLNNANVNKTDIIEASIRADSVKKEKFEKDNVGQINFIVDLPKYEQSFQVNYVYSTHKQYNGKIDINYRTMVYCPQEVQKKYANQTCRDRYAGQAEEIIQKFDFR